MTATSHGLRLDVSIAEGHTRLSEREEPMSDDLKIPDGEYGHNPSAPVGKMQKVSETIAYFQNVLDNFGNSCVYVRPGGVSWGAVALNREAEDKALGVAGSDLDRVTRDYASLASRHRCQSEAIVERFSRICALQSEVAKSEARVIALERALREYRLRVHNLDGHNQWFERCESAWCHPSEGRLFPEDLVQGDRAAGGQVNG